MLFSIVHERCENSALSRRSGPVRRWCSWSFSSRFWEEAGKDSQAWHRAPHYNHSDAFWGVCTAAPVLLVSALENGDWPSEPGVAEGLPRDFPCKSRTVQGRWRWLSPEITFR